MKLSPEELAEVERQAAAIAPGHNRTAPGQPGSRAELLSYAALLAQRRVLLGRPDA